MYLQVKDLKLQQANPIEPTVLIQEVFGDNGVGIVDDRSPDLAWSQGLWGQYNYKWWNEMDLLLAWIALGILAIFSTIQLLKWARLVRVSKKQEVER